LGQHTSENSGLKQSVINRGQHSLTALAYMVLYQIMPVAIEIILLVGALLYFSYFLGLIALATIVFYMWYVIRVNSRFQTDFKKLDKIVHRDSKFRGEILRNVELVLVNAQEPKAQAESAKSMTDVSDFARSVWMRFWNTIGIRNGIASLGRGFILMAGALLVVNGKHTVGQLVMFLGWANWALGDLHEIGHLHKQIVQLYTSLKKYFDMLAVPPDVVVMENPVSPQKFRGDIEFRNVTFRYRSRDEGAIVEASDEFDEEVEEEEEKSILPALSDVCFSIRAGETVAFVGESGAGKSTAVSALLRAQDPDAGQIVVDGHDLRVLDLQKYRESIGVVNQEVMLFDNTLRYNIVYGLNGRGQFVTEEELNRIAEMACVNRFFPRLEKGYDTLIGERGIKLSGGEKQRVGIARALIKNPDILIFDEATSNLDSENERFIRDSIETASKGRTTIIIAHRFSTIRSVDKVVVFDQGKIAGVGTHSELATYCEPYQRLIKNQVF
jgi:ATP-binding cassette subfamily B protein